MQQMSFMKEGAMRASRLNEKETDANERPKSTKPKRHPDRNMKTNLKSTPIIIGLSLFACNITKKRPIIHYSSEYFGIVLTIFIGSRLQMPSIIHLLTYL